jgi:hypothetical protein
VQDAAAMIPEDLVERLVSGDSLSDEDRQIIVEIGREALAGFQPESQSQYGPEHQPESEPDSEPDVEPKLGGSPKPTASAEKRQA